MNGRFLATAIIIASLAGCGGGSYGTGVRNGFEPLPTEVEDARKNEAFGWFLSRNEPTCSHDGLDLSLSSEFGPIKKSDGERCAAEVPLQAHRLALAVRSKKPIISSWVPFTLSTKMCGQDSGIKALEGSLRFAKGGLLLPEIRWSGEELYDLTVTIEGVRVTIELYREGQSCKQ